MERDKALEGALAQIEKQYGKGAVMRMGEKAVGSWLNASRVEVGEVMTAVHKVTKEILYPMG